MVEKYKDQGHYITSITKERPYFLAVLKPKLPEYRIVASEYEEENRFFKVIKKPY